MSIQQEIEWRLNEGRLVIHEPVLKGSNKRVLLVESGFYSELESIASSQNEQAFRVGLLIRDFDRFSNGSRIVVGYGTEDSCFIKMLDPYSDEIWELRSRDPKPAWRVFCRFALPDVLLALNASPRSELGAEGSREWREAIRDCKSTRGEDCFLHSPRLVEIPQVTTSQKMSLSSTISLRDERIPVFELGYLTAAARDEAHETFLNLFVQESEQDSRVTRAFIARRTGKSPEQITRLLGAPGNWTVDTYATLCAALGYRAVFRAEKLSDIRAGNLASRAL